VDLDIFFLYFKEEIAALEAKLSRLKEKEMELTESIKQEENKIESVKMTFSSEQNALDKQQQEIEAREKSLQEEFVSENKLLRCNSDITYITLFLFSRSFQK